MIFFVLPFFVSLSIDRERRSYKTGRYRNDTICHWFTYYFFSFSLDSLNSWFMVSSGGANMLHEPLFILVILSCSIFLGLGCTGMPYASGYTNLIFALLTFVSSFLFANCADVNGKLFGPVGPPEPLDAFVANNNNQANRVYINDGMNPPGFTSNNDPDSMVMPMLMESSEGVALGDLDGDGDLDAFVVNNPEANRVYINDGMNPHGFTPMSVEMMATIVPSPNSTGVVLGHFRSNK